MKSRAELFALCVSTVVSYRSMPSDGYAFADLSLEARLLHSSLVDSYTSKQVVG